MDLWHLWLCEEPRLIWTSTVNIIHLQNDNHFHLHSLGLNSETSSLKFFFSTFVLGCIISTVFKKFNNHLILWLKNNLFDFLCGWGHSSRSSGLKCWKFCFHTAFSLQINWRCRQYFSQSAQNEMNLLSSPLPSLLHKPLIRFAI